LVRVEEESLFLSTTTEKMGRTRNYRDQNTRSRIRERKQRGTGARKANAAHPHKSSNVGQTEVRDMRKNVDQMDAEKKVTATMNRGL